MKVLCFKFLWFLLLDGGVLVNFYVFLLYLCILCIILIMLFFDDENLNEKCYL